MTVSQDPRVDKFHEDPLSIAYDVLHLSDNDIPKLMNNESSIQSLEELFTFRGQMDKGHTVFTIDLTFIVAQCWLQRPN